VADTNSFANFIASDLEVERARRAAQEKSAVEIIKTSSAFVALVVAGAALLLGKEFKATDPLVQGLIVGALLLFVLSALSALIVGQLVPYLVATTATLKAALTDHWNDAEADRLAAVTWINFDTLTSLRKECNRKSTWLTWALRFQVRGALVLALGVGLLVLGLF
jgi:F0F1-type ATP synthase assembly protein I